MTSRNFGQFLTTLSPLSHVLLLRPCYCFHKILNPLPHKTVASFMDKPLPTFEWFCRTFAAPCVRKIPILMIALCVRGRAREYNRETKTRPTVNSVSLKQTEYLFSVFFFFVRFKSLYQTWQNLRVACVPILFKLPSFLPLNMISLGPGIYEYNSEQ